MDAKIGIIGYGSWATALVRQLSMNGVEISWLVTNPEIREGLVNDGHNPKYVPDARIDMDFVKLCDNIDETVRNTDYVLLCCPSAYLKYTLEPLTESLQGKFIISAIKGIVPDDNTTVLEYIHEHYSISWHDLAVISGPTHAEEVSNGRNSYICAAAADEDKTELIRNLLEGPRFKIESCTDIYGVEYAGILKNIYAIVAGMASGLGYGDNFRAVLISAAAAEMEHFLNASYPFERNVMSKAYLGDLLVTCYSEFSRNRRLGKLIGKGCSVKSALNEMTMIAEGYFSAKLIREVKSLKNIDMPIADFAYDVLYCKANPRKRMAELALKF